MTEPSSRTRVLLPVSVAISKEQMMAGMLPLLRFHASKLVVFHVYETAKKTTSGDGTREEEFVSARETLDSLAEWLRGQGYDVEVKTETARDVVGAIVKEAMRSEYSMVFMLKRKGTRGIQRFFTKSVTDSVVKRTECPVVSVLV